MKKITAKSIGTLLAAVLLVGNPAAAQESTVPHAAPVKDPLQIRFDNLQEGMPLQTVLSLMRNVPSQVERIHHLNFDAQHLVWEGAAVTYKVLLLDGRLVSKVHQLKTLMG